MKTLVAPFRRAWFVISLHIEMAHGAGLTSVSFCAVPLKSNNVLRYGGFHIYMLQGIEHVGSSIEVYSPVAQGDDE